MIEAVAFGGGVIFEEDEGLLRGFEGKGDIFLGADSGGRECGNTDSGMEDRIRPDGSAGGDCRGRRGRWSPEKSRVIAEAFEDLGREVAVFEGGENGQAGIEGGSDSLSFGVHVTLRLEDSGDAPLSETIMPW